MFKKTNTATVNVSNINTNEEASMRVLELCAMAIAANTELKQEEAAMSTFSNNMLRLALEEAMEDLDNGVEVLDVQTEVSGDEGDQVVTRSATPTALEARGIYDCVATKITYTHNPKERREYVENGIKITKLPTYHPVVSAVALTEDDYLRKEQYANDALNTDCDGVVVPSPEAIVELEEYATKNMTRTSFSPNDDTFVRARLYQAVTGKNGKTYRYDLKLADIWFDIEDMGADSSFEITSHIEDQIALEGLKFSDKLHIVISGNAVRRLVEDRCDHSDEWQDKLQMYNADANIYVQLPISTLEEDNIFYKLEAEFNAGIQTGTQFEAFDSVTLGLWQDYLSITEEVEERTALEATRPVVTKKMVAPRKTSAVDKKACYESIMKVINGLHGSDRTKAALISTGAVVGINPEHIKPAMAYIYAGGGSFLSRPLYYALQSLVPAKKAA
jgi:hypothetical protein